MTLDEKMNADRKASIDRYITDMKRMRLSVSGPETLDAAFLGAMQEIGLFGVMKYPANHYKLHEERPLEDGKPRDMLKHAHIHLINYEQKYFHELGDPRYHLAAAAFNIMMEFYFFIRKNKAR